MESDSDMMGGSSLPEDETSAPGIAPERGDAMDGDAMDEERDGEGMRDARRGDADAASDPELDPDPVRDANPETDGVG